MFAQATQRRVLAGTVAAASRAEAQAVGSVFALPGEARAGWVATGSFVTIVLAPKPDDLVDGPGAGPASFAGFGGGGGGGSGAAAGAGGPWSRDAASFAAMAASGDSAAPMALHGLHRHENRLSVVNGHVARAAGLFLEPGQLEPPEIIGCCLCNLERFPVETASV